jgi:hypothetical protein
MLDDQHRPIDVHCYERIGGLVGQMWEQEIRVLLRVTRSRLSGLPTIIAGGYRDAEDVAKAGGGSDGMALVATRGAQYTLADDGGRDYVAAQPAFAFRQFVALADALAELHDLGIAHRNLWPGAVYAELDGSERLWIARFEMSVLVANLFRSVLTDPQEVLADLRQMFLAQDARSLAYCPPERLAFLFPAAERVRHIEGPRSDIYSLATIVWEWFCEPIPDELLPTAKGHDPADVRERTDALNAHLRGRVGLGGRSTGQRTLPRELGELLQTMLDPVPRSRPSADEVVRVLRRDFEAILGHWDRASADNPHLVFYMPSWSAPTIYSKWNMLSHAPDTDIGRRELGDLVQNDLRGAKLVYSPHGAAPYVRSGELTDKREAKFVLIGTNVVWFCKRYQLDEGPGRLGPPDDRALIVKYVAQRHHPALRRSLEELVHARFQREVPEVITFADDADREAKKKALTDSPFWTPLLDAVSATSAESPDDLREAKALDLVLRYHGIQLQATSYAYTLAEHSGDTATVEFDPDRDRAVIRADDMLNLYADSPRLRPLFGDFFEDLEDQNGDSVVEIVADRDGHPAPSEHSSEWKVEKKAGQDRVRLRRKQSGRRAIPERGWIRPVDYRGAEVSIKRQAAARWDLVRAKALMGQLRSPHSIITIPQRWQRAGERLHGEDSRKAVREMLTNIPFYALHGPPGTGKTTVVAEAIAEHLRLEPTARILVSAQSTFALDNLARRILHRLGALNDDDRPTGNWDGVALRVTSRMGTPPDDVIEPWLWRNMVDRRATETLRKVKDTLDNGVEEGLEEPLEEWRRLLEGTGENVRPELSYRLERATNLVFATCAMASTDAVISGDARSVFDWVIVEEAARAWPTELAMPLVGGLRWTLVGDHRQLPAHRQEDFERFLTRCANDPHADFGISREDHAYYLEVLHMFRRVFRKLDDDGLSQAEKDVLPLRMLRTQFRMRRPIAEVISRVFYPAKVNEFESDGLPRGTLSNGVQIDPLPLRSPAFLTRESLVWLDTHDVHECSEELRWSNKGEADLVARLVDLIRPVPAPRVDGYTNEPLAVLTPYRAQADLLRQHAGLRDRVFTIHAFQGQEADIVVVSLVRDKIRGDPNERPWESLGHLSRRDLTNVMLSRARKLLVVVGDYQHFATFQGAGTSTPGDEGAAFWGQVCRAVEMYGIIIPAERALSVEEV